LSDAAARGRRAADPGVAQHGAARVARAGRICTISIAWQLARLDVLRRYTATMLGIVWAVLAPLLISAVIGLVFAKLFGQDLREFLPYLFELDTVGVLLRDDRQRRDRLRRGRGLHQTDRQGVVLHLPAAHGPGGVLHAPARLDGGDGR
jgi:hypothetical protein